MCLETLENFCLNKICLNLSLNYYLIKNFNIKLPKSFGQKIFNNCFKIINFFTENDLKFFNKNISSLKTIDICKKQFKKIKYFDFLNQHNLDNISIGNIDNFYLKNEASFSIITKNLIITNMNCSIVRDINIFNIFLSKCIVTESIVCHLKQNQLFTNYDNLLFNNNYNSIKILNITGIEVCVHHLYTLKQFFIKNNSLIELSLFINHSSRKNDDSTDINMKNFLLSIPNTIRILHLEFFYFDDDIFENFSIVIKNLINLNEIFIQPMPYDAKMVKEILKSLAIYTSDRLTKIGLIFSEVNYETNKILVKYLKKFQYLKKVCIRGENFMENDLFFDIISSLNQSAQYIEEFDFLFNGIDTGGREFNKFLPNCYSLKEFDISYFLDEGTYPYYVLLAMNNCRKTINLLKLYHYRLSKDFSEQLSAINLIAVTEILLVRVLFDEGSLSYFLSSVKQSATKLKALHIRQCQLTEDDGLIIGKFLRECSLKFIDIRSNPQLKTGINSIIKELENSKNTLESINFSYCQFDVIGCFLLAKLIKNCQHIKYLNLNNTNLTDDCLKRIFMNLKNSKGYLQYLDIDMCRISSSTFNELRKYTANFPSLEKFINGNIITDAYPFPALPNIRVRNATFTFIRFVYELFEYFKRY